MMRERIIETACQLSIELGIKSATMDDIAQRAGVSKKTLYKYFKDKTDLIRHTVLYVTENLNKQAEAFVSEEQNPIRRLYIIDRFYATQPIAKAHSPQKQLQKFYPKIYKEMQDKELEMVGNSIKKNLQKGIEMGLYREDIDLDFSVRLFLHISFESGNNLPFLTPFYDENTISAKYLEYHIRAIATPKGVAVLEEILKEL